MNRYDYLLNLRNASTALLKKEISAVELVKLSLERIHAQQSSNVFITVNAEQALREAQAYDALPPGEKQHLPLGGIPIAIKDNIHVKGLPCTLGTPALQDFRPIHNAYVVRALKDAGAIIIGKTHLHELALGVTGYNPNYCQEEHIGTRNAHNNAYIAGGSSSGSAVAVASMHVPFSLGTDSAGSTRIPAALNGCVGYRPSLGRYSTEGVAPLSTHRDTVGGLSSNVVDIVQIDKILRPNPPSAQKFQGPIRLGVIKEAWAQLDSEVEHHCLAALERIKQQGIQVVELRLPRSFELAATCSAALILYDFPIEFSGYLSACDVGLSYADIQRQVRSPDIKALIRRLITPQRLPSEAGGFEELDPIYQEAISHWRPAMLQEYQDAIKAHNLHGFLFPTVSTLAPLATAESNDPQHFERLTRNILPGSCIGLAGMSLPVAFAGDQLAVGLSIDVMPNQDELLFIIASKVEQALGFAKGITPPTL